MLKPFSPVSRDTISRWVKTIMPRAGIDTTKFKPHSTRAASTSAASRNAVPLENILTAAVGKVTVYLPSITTSQLEANPFLKVCRRSYNQFG